MDPMDDFEFKPLSEGLGFHKKNKATDNKFSQSNIMDKITTKLNQNLPDRKDVSFMSQGTVNTQVKSFEMSSHESLISNQASDLMMPTLPRKNTNTSIKNPNTQVKKETPQNNAVDEILKTLKSRNLDFENNKQTLKEIKNPKTIAPEYKETVVHFSAAILDTMLITAATLLCLIIVLFVTKVDLFKIVFNPDNQGMVYLSLFSIFSGVQFIYLVINRVFAGFTPGEWAFDLRVGKPEEQNQSSYILRVMARTLLNMITGFILLPIISAIIRTDIAGYLTGAQIYKKA